MMSSLSPAGALSDSMSVVKPNSYDFPVTSSNTLSLPSYAIGLNQVLILVDMSSYNEKLSPQPHVRLALGL